MITRMFYPYQNLDYDTTTVWNLAQRTNHKGKAYPKEKF